MFCIKILVCKTVIYYLYQILPDFHFIYELKCLYKRLDKLIIKLTSENHLFFFLLCFFFLLLFKGMEKSIAIYFNLIYFPFNEPTQKLTNICVEILFLPEKFITPLSFLHTTLKFMISV